MSGFTNNLSNLPPGCSDAHIERQQGVKPKPKRDDLRDAATEAYNTLVDAMDTLIVCDHISMMRHPQLVDKMHRAVNGLKRAIHACKP